MRILLVSNMYPSELHPYYGTFVERFCEQLDELKIEYSKSVMTGSNTKLEKIRKYIFFYVESFAKALWGNFDLVYIHYPSYSALGVLAARKLRKFPIYVNLHGSDTIPVNSSHERMLKFSERAVALADKVVVPSEYFKRIAGEKFNYPLNQIFVYPSGGIDKRVFKKQDSEKIQTVKAGLGISSDEMIVSFIGRMVRAKGWDTFLEAAKIVTEHGYNVRFLMVGSGSDDLLVADYIERNRMTNVMRLPQQPQGKLVDLYNISDVFVFSSSSESLGLVGLEAMACGTPVIASDYAGPGEYVIDGENGYKFTMGDSSALAEKIEAFLNSRVTEREVLSLGALRTAEKYGAENIAPSLMRIFSS